MIIYIKDRKTFTTKAVVNAVDYEIHESIYDTVSRMTIPTPENLPIEGDFVLADGMAFVGLVSEVDTDGGRTDLSVEQGVKLFSRDMFYTPQSYTYLEDYLKSLIDDNYTDCSDEVYEMPFLSINALTHTNKACKPDLDGGTYNIKSYISKLRRIQDIVCTWDFDRTTLTLNIFKKSFAVYSVDMSNPRFKITEQSISHQTVGKITVYCEENDTYTDWYLKTDGTVTQTYSTTNRVDGEWVIMTVRETADVEDSVRDEFAKNYYSHKITFITDKDFGMYDRLLLRIDGKIFSSYVSGLITKKGSKLRTVECGELQTYYPFLNRL